MLRLRLLPFRWTTRLEKYHPLYAVLPAVESEIGGAAKVRVDDWIVCIL